MNELTNKVKKTTCLNGKTKNQLTQLSRQIFVTHLVIALLTVTNTHAFACSTFKLQKGDSLVYGHNLNEGDIGVPGMAFINKRGIFKIGRTWSEIISKNQTNVSSYTWISRFGSVTFNGFGRDFPDGGMNEEGLFIWEMNEDTEYPKNKNLPKLNQMNWMQYILDNYSTTEEAIKCASEIEIDGWGWHFFVGDTKGNTAAIEFFDGKVVVHNGENMPVAGLFNNPYERELELLKYYKGFGGDYDPTLNNPRVPRFVKTAVLTRDYNLNESVVDYGIKMLHQLMVDDEPEWSILFDARKKNIYFKTRINPEIKTFSMSQIDFSNNTPTSVLNIDIEKGGNVYNKFTPYTNEIMHDFIKNFTKNILVPFLPKFCTAGGLTVDEYIERTTTHTDAAKSNEKQFFKGTWMNNPENPDKDISMTLKLESINESVRGSISLGKEFYPIDHLCLLGNKLRFTFKTGKGTLLEVKADFTDGKMVAEVLGIENSFGKYSLDKISTDN
ncbi:MAG: linear amide C-N hydrolase [Bacteroidales bacterium]